MTEQDQRVLEEVIEEMNDLSAEELVELIQRRQTGIFQTLSKIEEILFGEE